MKVLFINRFLGRDTIFREPLGVMSLAAAIEPKHKAFIVDPIQDDVDKKISKINPDVVAYSTRTGYHQFFIDLNQHLKRKYNFISVFGGPHATLFPEMIGYEGVDCVCRGEGEEAFLEFLDALEENKDVTHIKNFWIKKDGKVTKNPLRPLVENLDKLKFPSRSLFNDYKDIKDSKVKSFIIERGCPFNCSYCFNAGFKELYKGQRYVRRRSVKNLIDEVKEVKKNYGLEQAILEVDTLNFDKKWLKEFAKEFKKLNLRFICTGMRADLFDEDDAKLLKEANCQAVLVGLESGSEEVRKKILNRHMSNDKIINCVRLLHKYGIKCVTENLVAIPGSSLEDDLKTLELNVICKPDYVNSHILQPYPSTKIYQFSVQNGFCEDIPFDNIGSFYGQSKLKIDHKLERENLQRLIALATRFPRVNRNIRWLIKLKITPVYELFFNIYKAYCGGSWWFSYKKSWSDYVYMFKRYFINKECDLTILKK